MAAAFDAAAWLDSMEGLGARVGVVVAGGDVVIAVQLNQQHREPDAERALWAQFACPDDEAERRRRCWAIAGAVRARK